MDPSKKATIDALLNPQREYSANTHSSVSNFHLRAANWDQSPSPYSQHHPHNHNNTSSPVNNGHRPHYQHSSGYQYPQTYPYPHAHGPGSPHGPTATPTPTTTATPTAYSTSDERTTATTAMTASNRISSSKHSNEYRESYPQDGYNNTWQASQRASVRLAARDTLVQYQTQQQQPPQQSYEHQNSRYPTSPLAYYSPTVLTGHYGSSSQSIHAQAYSSSHSHTSPRNFHSHPPGEYRPSTSTSSSTAYYHPQPHSDPTFSADVRQQQTSPSSSNPISNTAAPSNPVTTPVAEESSRKRSHPDSSEAYPSEPAPKRAKGKGKAQEPGNTTTSGSTSTLKRGYNAEKRNKVAQITAQNGQLLPTVSYAPVQNQSGKDPDPTAPMRIVTGDNGQINGLVTENAVPLHPELQFARCMSNRYRAETFPRCVSCTRRWAGDTCRFQGIRFFLKDRKRDVVGITFVEGRYEDAVKMVYPNKWNRELTDRHVKRMKVAIAKALLPILKQEREHIKLPELIRRPRESEVRATCDTCMTSLFSSTWMCRLCGREACSSCFYSVKELTIDKPGASQVEVAALQSRREKHAHSNPFFLSCTRRNEHMAKDFSPVSRFFQEELDEAIPEMERLIATMEDEKNMNLDTMVLGADSIDERVDRDTPTVSSEPSTTLPGPSHDHEEQPTPPYIPPNLPPITQSLPFPEVNRYTHAQISNGDSIDIFAPIWAKGEPIVTTGILNKFKISWTPEYFIEHYGDQSCLIIECQTDANKRVTVSDFFSLFGSYDTREESECWKLKDWPPSTDFKIAFPELYNDFAQAMPVPDYIRRDGISNVASHFPENTVKPDLGPKMYNALASQLTKGSKGTTRLHMDMADAVNVMTFAEKCKDGSDGCAAWDLFKASDSEKLRNFLKLKFPKPSAVTDPIHSQQHYLDEVLLKELFEVTGVLPYRVYQKPGEGVFIPAGCAHQVANLSDCVKVAVDFVSVENIARCEGLTREFRELNRRLVWKEDVLQLGNTMWFAWVNCGKWEKERMNGGSGGGSGNGMSAIGSGSTSSSGITEGSGSGTESIDSMSIREKIGGKGGRKKNGNGTGNGKGKGKGKGKKKNTTTADSAIGNVYPVVENGSNGV